MFLFILAICECMFSLFLQIGVVELLLEMKFMSLF